MIDLLRRAHARFLFWKWDREYYRALRRMRGCEHQHTIFVDVGSGPYGRIEKCLKCWALKVPKLDGSKGMEWTPNSAKPRRRA